MEWTTMDQNTGIVLITIGGIIAMSAIGIGFVKVMINTLNYSKNKYN